MAMNLVMDALYNKAFFARDFLLTKRSTRNILRHNTRLSNIHRGGSCFILGNGPSLKNDQLDLLSGQTVFTVNQAYRNHYFNTIHPQYHFWVDRNFFALDLSRSEDVDILNCMQKTALSSEDIHCFYPIDQYNFVKNNGLLVEGRTFFLNPILRFGSVSSFNPDISRLTYSCGTVVQNAIVAAIYMGFSEIYILGCDSTGIINTLNASMKIDNKDYGYEVTQNEKLRMEKMVERSRVTDYAYSYYMTLKGFDYLYNVCVQKGIRLINCTSTTVLDMIPRLPFENVIKEKERKYENHSNNAN